MRPLVPAGTSWPALAINRVSSVQPEGQCRHLQASRRCAAILLLECGPTQSKAIGWRLVANGVSIVAPGREPVPAIAMESAQPEGRQTCRRDYQ